ncbi:MAG: GAF domain-containing sensor histidine kinase [Candidatus Omnitrophica bacterium]|nr:GAF domain-containing sensor histidine kinase [Candidatus Omnitrophota bacterium]MDE2010305.1 GAF domain-containing sensor histidine kinase [Candidatus Omnitrophota bacterium]MDE2215272.1 GAF domain-containing sensor histidine kinase [Candidatus Omnitrophota bacterium]MDE2232024.1 GAF domain-containing sensor histidine kinase [Candidatus Omnitrophota bacterium]
MDSSSPAMLHILTALTIIIFILICAVVYLIYVFIAKEDVITKMKEEHGKLLRSFNDLDEQAKLIVRTDLELHKTREEMNKRLNGLNALQRTSRQMIQALNEGEIFQRIPPALFEDLGFSHILIACVNADNVLKTRLSVGYKDTRAEAILKEVSAEESLKSFAHPLSFNNCPVKTRQRIIQIFESEHFILVPILAQTGNIGFVFTGYGFNAPALTHGDEELVTILAGQIGQSIENARLFEKVFLSSQQLELKVAERTKQLASALQKVNEISKKKSEFISAVSHELRTPLTSIKGYASILIAGKIGDVPAPVKDRLAKINTHSDNLVGLINNLLDIARIESNRQEMKFADYKIKTMVDNVADLLAPQMTAKGVKLQLRLCPEVENIYADASQVERVLINLLSNAVKFTPAQGTITIEVSPTLNEGFACFSVSDTGIGIPATEIQKLFNEFFRVDNEINQNVKGTGLGLVLAKNIVQAHRGKIWLESKVGAGTTFYFTLPPSQKAFEEHLTPEKNYAP